MVLLAARMAHGCGMSLEHFTASCMATYQFVIDRDGPPKDVIDDDDDHAQRH